MAVINPVGYLEGRTDHTSLVDRLASAGGIMLPAVSTELRARGGVRLASDMKTTVVSGMTVRVSPGMGYIPAQTVVGGTYSFPNDGNVDITLGAAHATLTRYDLIVARVQDAAFAGALNIGDIVPIQGTASATPADPPLPPGASYLVLDRVVVGPGVTTPSSIVRMARVTQVAGTIIPVTAADTVPGLRTGDYRDHPTLGLQRWDGTQWSNFIWPAGAPFMGGAGPNAVQGSGNGGFSNVLLETDVVLNGFVRTTGFTTTRFSPLVAGWYEIWGLVSWAGNNLGRRIPGVQVNGTLVASSQVVGGIGSSSAFQLGTHSILVNLATTDSFGLQGYQDSGGVVNFSALGSRLWATYKGGG